MNIYAFWGLSWTAWSFSTHLYYHLFRPFFLVLACKLHMSFLTRTPRCPQFSGGTVTGTLWSLIKCWAITRILCLHSWQITLKFSLSQCLCLVWSTRTCCSHVWAVMSASMSSRVQSWGYTLHRICTWTYLDFVLWEHFIRTLHVFTRVSVLFILEWDLVGFSSNLLISSKSTYFSFLLAF